MKILNQEKRMDLGYLALALALAAFVAAACAHRKTMAASSAGTAPAGKPAAAAPDKPASAKPGRSFSRLARGLAVHKFWGVIESENAAQDEVAVKSKLGRVKNFFVLSDTRLSRGGEDKAIGFSALKAGERVRVIYAGKYAKAVHVMIPASHGG